MELYLGTTIDEDDEQENDWPVSLIGEEVNRGIFVCGQPGTGKTALLQSVINDLYNQGVAFIYIDPTGFSARRVYSITRGEADFCSLDHPYGLNPLRQPFRPQVVVEIVIDALNEVMRLTAGDSIKQLTPNMKNIIVEVILGCLRDGAYSLLEVRRRIAGINHHAEAKDGLLARFDNLLSDPRMNSILCGGQTVDIARISAGGRPLIVSCEHMSKAQRIFAGNLVTSSLVNFLLYADHSTLNPCVLLLDEAHNFLSDNVMPQVMKEARQYSLSVVAATQDLAYFSELMRRVVLNSGTVLTFTVAHHEANIMAKELLTSAEVVQSLDKYTYLLKTPSFRGLVRAPFPPADIPFPLPEPVTPITVPASVPVAVTATPTTPSATKPRLKWFSIAPLRSTTTNVNEATAEADTAETASSRTRDDTIFSEQTLCGVARPTG